MPTTERLRNRGTRRGQRILSTLSEEFRDKRLAVGLSQRQVAMAAGISRPTYSRVETVGFDHLAILSACQIAAVLGLELAVRVFPGAEPMRDAASATRLSRVMGHVAAPLTYRTEVPLPQTPVRPFEQRAWDALITGHGKRTALELEMRLRDAQALERRFELKRRDDPVDSFVLLLANTRANRDALREHPTLFPDLTRLTFRELTRMLRAGQHPPNALVFV